jgi:hypothetical protein
MWMSLGRQAEKAKNQKRIIRAGIFVVFYRGFELSSPRGSE